MILRSKHADDLNAKIDELYGMFRAVRWIIQYVGPKYEGQKVVKWKSRIPSNEILVTYNFDKPINEETRSELNKISEYENQNFIVRLYALLQYEGLFNKGIDKSLEGHQHVSFLENLRHQFAHKPGKFNPKNKKSNKLRLDLFEFYKINPDDSLPDQFPLPKDIMIHPMVNGVKNYVKHFYEEEGL
ncbi:MAG: hypothetical protein COA31_013955 [Flavobacteriales bacterium]|jgi:hypothetical protein|nr:hypothetical protein [Flavobacteriales bacterium]